MRMDENGITWSEESTLRALARVSRAPGAPGASRREQALWRFCLATASPMSHDEREELVSFMRGLDEASWRQLLALAQIHGVAPLLFWRLAKADLLSAIPSAIASAFKETYTQTLINNRRMQSVFQAVVGELSAAGIGVMPLKGLVLAHRYYGDLALRPMTDMDVLVRQEDVARAASALRRLGYHAADGMGSPSGFYAMTSATVAYARPQSLSIEIHWELFGRQAYRLALPAAAVWARSEGLAIFEQSVRYLHPRDQIWYLSVHAAIEHRLQRLIWLVDIARCINALPADWDWDRFAHETVIAGVALPVVATLAYCRAFLGVTAPGSVLEYLDAAAETPRERATCEAAQSDLLSADWIRMAAASTHGPKELVIFLRGVLAPRRATLEALYGPDATRWRAIPGAYVRHALRVAGPTARALQMIATRSETI